MGAFRIVPFSFIAFLLYPLCGRVRACFFRSSSLSHFAPLNRSAYVSMLFFLFSFAFYFSFRSSRPDRSRLFLFIFRGIKGGQLILFVRVLFLSLEFPSSIFSLYFISFNIDITFRF